MARKLRVFSPDESNELQPAQVFTATIVTVDPDTYQIKIRSKHLSGISGSLEMPSLLMNIRDGSGAGIHLIPEVGSEIWVCRTSDGTLVPLSYHGAIGESYKNNRPTGIPGDIYLSTSDGNNITVGKGGAISLTSSPVCHLMLSPIDDAIYTMSREIKSYCNASAQEFLCLEGRQTVSVYKYFEESEQNDPSTRISIGYTGRGNTYMSDINLLSPDYTVSYAVKSTGDVTYKSNAATVQTADLTLTTQNVVSTNEDISITGQNVTLSTQKVGWDSQDVAWTCTDFHVAPTLATVGAKATAEPLLKSVQLQADLVTLCTAIQTFTASPGMVTVSGADTTGTTTTALTALASAATTLQTKLASGVYTTNKLKSE